MRTIVAAVLACGCQQAKPEPPSVPLAARDAAVVVMDGPVTFQNLTLGAGVDRIPHPGSAPARTASAPAVWALASENFDPDAPRMIVFDAAIVSITRVVEHAGRPVGSDEQAWLVELGDHTDRAARSFVVEAPADLGIDLHVGQQVHGDLSWTDTPPRRDHRARIVDEHGIVIAFDPAEPAYRIGKKTTGFSIMGYEEAHQVEANLGGTVWTPLAGWGLQKLRAHDYECYGLAVELAPDRDVTDFAGSTTFAMFRAPRDFAMIHDPR